MSLLEKTIENCVVTWTKQMFKAGVMIRKMNGQGHRGWPDRAFWFDGIHFMIEFKKEGELPDPAQANVMAMLSDLGVRCYVVDNIEDGKAIIAAEASGNLLDTIVQMENKWGHWLQVADSYKKKRRVDAAGRVKVFA